MRPQPVPRSIPTDGRSYPLRAFTAVVAPHQGPVTPPNGDPEESGLLAKILTSGQGFTRQRGRAEYRQHRSSGALYCSALCPKAKVQRKYPRPHRSKANSDRRGPVKRRGCQRRPTSADVRPRHSPDCCLFRKYKNATTMTAVTGPRITGCDRIAPITSKIPMNPPRPGLRCLGGCCS